MNQPAQETSDTQSMILNAAGELFAEKGFHQTTIREICQRAGTNIAAVNYHFRDKQGLYREVMRHWFLVARDRFPIQKAVEEQSSPDQKLYVFIRTFLYRILGTGAPAWHGKLMALEMVEPTDVLHDLVELVIRPQYVLLTSIIRSLIGNNASDDQVRRCCLSVIGQCMIYRHGQSVFRMITPDAVINEQEILRIAEHVTKVSLAAFSSFAEDLKGERSCI